MYAKRTYFFTCLNVEEGGRVSKVSPPLESERHFQQVLGNLKSKHPTKSNVSATNFESMQGVYFRDSTVYYLEGYGQAKSLCNGSGDKMGLLGKINSHLGIYTLWTWVMGTGPTLKDRSGPARLGIFAMVFAIIVSPLYFIALSTSLHTNHIKIIQFNLHNSKTCL